MSRGTDYLTEIVNGTVKGIPSLCSSNDYVIKAAFEYGIKKDCFILIEATANQVNQYGGYTGMKPQDFKEFVFGIAKETGFSTDRLILGGDHLGPLFAKEKDEEIAMKDAEVVIDLFVRAGFEKIHIDTSMLLGSDDPSLGLTDKIIARRGARLCKVAEQAFLDEFNKPSELIYVIGSEVPVPGGAQNEHEDISVTSKEAFFDTVNEFKEAFKNNGLEEAFKRVMAVVVQPGVEFGDDSVDDYNRENARELTNALKEYKSIVFEGHSTDYQTSEKLKEMVEDGISVLKVGPELTFALREGLLSLQHIADAMKIEHNFINDLDRVMSESPEHWEKYYLGDSSEIEIKRKYSYSDRWRYYYNRDEIKGSILELLESVDAKQVPLTLIKQFMPYQYKHIREGKLNYSAENLIMDKITEVIDKYYQATE